MIKPDITPSSIRGGKIFHQCACRIYNKSILRRNYSENQYKQFEESFRKMYPRIYKEIVQSTSCISGIIYEIYDSDIFYKVLK